ncbi:hypothetical protein Tco_0811734, partial [Tanacetum coccineum]
DANNEMFDVNVLNGEEVFVAGKKENVVEEVVNATQVSTAATAITITTKEITLAQALEALKTSKPKVKGIVFQDPESVKPMKKKDLIRLDEEVALKLQAEFDEKERLAREKAEEEKEANIALIEEWDDIQAKIDTDYQLKRRKHFAAKRAEEKRNKPQTQAQQRKIMCTYLKNMEGYKLKDLKLKEFDSIQELFDKAFKRVDDDKEITKLKQCMEIIPDEDEVTIDAIPLAVKSPRIKKYPLTLSTLTMMLEKKLMIEYESEMAYQLLKFIVKQLKKRIVGIKSLLDAVGITTTQVCVNTAQLKLVLLRGFKENMLSVYYC